MWINPLNKHFFPGGGAAGNVDIVLSHNSVLGYILKLFLALKFLSTQKNPSQADLLLQISTQK